MTTASDTVELFGFDCRRATLEDAVADTSDAIAERRQRRILFLNAAKVVDDLTDYDRTLGQVERLYADGQSIVMAARLLGRRLPARVTGVDLMESLLEVGNHRGWRVFLLGSTDEVLELSRSVIAERFPGVTVVGSNNGYFGADRDGEMADRILESSPDLVFVAMPSPRKEEWVTGFGPRTGAPVVMAVGGSLEVLTGKVNRAPVLLQRLGLEWAWRVAQEPRRLWRRYAKSNIAFIGRALGLAVRTRIAARSDKSAARAA